MLRERAYHILRTSEDGVSRHRGKRPGESGVGEGYKKKDSCLNGIESIRKNSVDAKIEDTREK